MAISEEQLETWSHVGAQKQSAATYRAIKSILEHKDAPYASRRFEVFLQGSYGNDTNVYAESDVDIVIRLTSVYYSDIQSLNADEKRRYEANRIPGGYSFNQFKEEVTEWLRTHFGRSVSAGKKAIKVLAGNGRRDADVLVCVQHRHYHSYPEHGNPKYYEGICFWTTQGDKIVNYPKQHMKNCTEKHQATNNRFKPNIRVLKNMRNAMINDGFLRDGVAPSYFLEGMLWNVPEGNFVNSYQQSFENYLAWLERCNPTQLTCANALHWLIRDGEKICWNMTDYTDFLVAVRRYWNSGRR